MYIRQYTLDKNKIVIPEKNGMESVYNLTKHKKGYLNLPKYYEFRNYKVIRIIDGKTIVNLRERLIR